MPEWIGTALRLVQFAAAAPLFGAPLFCLYAAQNEGRWRERLNATALAAMALAVLLSVMAQTALLTGEAAAAANPSDLAWYLTDTWIGTITLCRIGLLALYAVAGAVMPGGRLRLAALAALGGLILASFAWTGHGIEGGALRLAADVIHLLTAGIWAGALVSLLLALQAARRQEISAQLVLEGLNAFSRIGVVVVALLAASGVINALPVLAGLSWTLARTPYGVTLGLKLLAFAGMLALAATHRFRLAPRLAAALKTGADPRLSTLHRSILAETLLVILVLGLAAHLGSIEPPGGHSH